MSIRSGSFRTFSFSGRTRGDLRCEPIIILGFSHAADPRRARHDIPEIAEIYGHYVRVALATFETEPPDAAEMARRRQDVLACGLPYLVAELDGRVAAFAYAARYRPRPASPD